MSISISCASKTTPCMTGAKAREERTYFMIRTPVHTSLSNNEQQWVWLASQDTQCGFGLNEKIWSNSLFCLGRFQTNAHICYQGYQTILVSCWFRSVLLEVLLLKITFEINWPKPLFHVVRASMRFKKKNKQLICDFYSPSMRRLRHTAMMGFRIPGQTYTRLSLWL